MRRKLYMILLALPAIIFSNCSSNNERKQFAAEQEIRIKKPATKAEESVFDSLDRTNLMKRLFDNPWFDSNDVALWKPNYYERMNFPVSNDGMCHTAVDTVMYFTDREKRQCAVVILATYNYQVNEFSNNKPEISDCHFCGVPIGIVLLAQHEDKKWHLYRFEKSFARLGYFGRFHTGRGDSGSTSLRKIGDSWTCLSLVQGPGGNGGYVEGSEMLYSIEEYQLGGFPAATLSNILTYSNYYSNVDAMDESRHDIEIKEDTTTMHIVEHKGAYYDIDLVTRGLNKKTSVAHYVYSDDAGVYMPR
ncbi:hypothetical protein ACTHGU_21315 [Chitinophagaceae bacterium MMS25-I14]